MRPAIVWEKPAELSTVPYPSQARGAAGAPAGDAVAGAAERANPPEDLTATLAAVFDRTPAPELGERLGLGRRAAPDADLPGEPLEERAVADPRALAAERPRVRRLVPERLLALGRRKVRGDRDPVRRAVNDLAARQLPAGQANPRRVESEACREAVVLALEERFAVLHAEREEGFACAGIHVEG